MLQIIGSETAYFVRNYRSGYNKTIFHYPLKPEIAQMIVDNMGDEAPEVLSEMLPKQHMESYKSWEMRQNPETLKIYKDIIRKNPDIFANAKPIPLHR